jgi:hypothetical protein
MLLVFLFGTIRVNSEIIWALPPNTPAKATAQAFRYNNPPACHFGFRSNP